MNQLQVNLQHPLATLAAKGWSARKIACQLGVHRETVGRFLRPAGAEARRVGVKEVREFLGAKTAGRFDRGIVVTTSRCTPDLLAFANENRIEILDGEAVTQLLNKHDVRYEVGGTSLRAKRPYLIGTAGCGLA